MSPENDCRQLQIHTLLEESYGLAATQCYSLDLQWLLFLFTLGTLYLKVSPTRLK